MVSRSSATKCSFWVKIELETRKLINWEKSEEQNDLEIIIDYNVFVWKPSEQYYRNSEDRIFGEYHTFDRILTLSKTEKCNFEYL